MFKIKLRNDKIFYCSKDDTIFEAAKSNNIILEHSCLSARCRSCVLKVIKGETRDVQKDFVLSPDEKQKNFVLSCNSKPLSDLELDIEDIDSLNLYEKRIIPSKINSIKYLTKDIIKLELRLPPNSNFKFHPGQFIKLIKGNIVRSYSISSLSTNNIELIIKKYKGGLMSNYLFKDAKINDLLRLEGPLGTFIFRKSIYKKIIFIATGTGIAPIKAILEYMDENFNEYRENSFWFFYGARYKDDLFWEPNFKNLRLNYTPVLSREKYNWKGEAGYVQDIVLKKCTDLENSQIYACGSLKMIEESKKKFIKNNLNEKNFFSDAFIETN